MMTKVNQSRKTGIVHFVKVIYKNSLKDYDALIRVGQTKKVPDVLLNTSRSVSMAAKLGGRIITCYYLTRTGKKFKKPGVVINGYVQSYSGNESEAMVDIIKSAIEKYGLTLGIFTMEIGEECVVLQSGIVSNTFSNQKIITETNETTVNPSSSYSQKESE